jgi:TfoX/Sxy family transcriptional regulator of competence genes
MIEPEIVDCLRDTLAGHGTIREQKMFGGTGFMLNGNMIAGTFRKGLLVRTGPERQAEALAQPGAGLMEMGGRMMEGYVHVEPGSLNPERISALVKLALPFVLAMPAKEKKAVKGKRK